MPKGRISFESSQIGTLSFETSHIYASGGPEFPVLIIRTQIGLAALTGYGQNKSDVNSLSLVRIEGDFCSPPHRAVGRFQYDLGLLANNPAREIEWQVNLNIPLSLETLKRVEDDRTGDLLAALRIRPLLAVHNTQMNGGGVSMFYIGRTEDLSFSIPQSDWIKFLRALGYGGLEILEVRYGSGPIAKELPKSVQEIQQAKGYRLSAEWDKAVSHCRKAIEVILDSRPPTGPMPARFRDRVNTFIGDHLKTLDADRSKLLADEMGMIWEVASQAVHPSSGYAFKRADAEFIVRATMALVEYFSRLLT